jgi:predicted Zn-dependent protease
MLAQAAARMPPDGAAQATLYFLTGLASQQARPPDVDAAIESYTKALARRPDLKAAHHNRAVAYLKRQEQGDAALALADLTAYLGENAMDATALTNRGTAHLLLGGSGEARLALADLDRALELEPDLFEAVLNRGLARLRLDDPGWEADFRRGLAIRPGDPGALEMLCWAFAVTGRPEKALPECDGALAAGDGQAARHGRAIAYALSGQHEAAAADLEAYLADLQPPLLERESPRVRAWIDELAAGRNPFGSAVLDELRQE